MIIQLSWTKCNIAEIGSYMTTEVLHRCSENVIVKFNASNSL